MHLDIKSPVGHTELSKDGPGTLELDIHPLLEIDI